MLVTGHQLKEIIHLKQLELLTIQTQFEDSLFKFEGEEKEHPADVVTQIQKLEHEIATLQTAQGYYNDVVTVTIEGLKDPVKLAYAIKAVGGAGRVAKMWRLAAQGKRRDRWDRMQAETRRTDEEKARPIMEWKEALKKAKEAEKFAGSMRSAIATGNTNEVSINFIDPTLFS